MTCLFVFEVVLFSFSFSPLGFVKAFSAGRLELFWANRRDSGLKSVN